MTNFQHFADFDLRCVSDPSADDDQMFLAARIFQGIHAAIVQECGDSASAQNTIAVGFPLSTDTYYGGLIRAFASDKAVLERMLRHPKIHRFAAGLNIRICDIPVTKKFAVFSRNRANDKSSPSALRRENARMELHKLTPKHPRKEGIGFNIKVNSESNGNEFIFRITKKDGNESANGSFNAYGLSSCAGVPVF